MRRVRSAGLTVRGPTGYWPARPYHRVVVARVRLCRSEAGARAACCPLFPRTRPRQPDRNRIDATWVCFLWSECGLAGCVPSDWRSLVSLVSLDEARGRWRRRGGNRRKAALIRLSPARCHIAAVTGLAPGPVSGGRRDRRGCRGRRSRRGRSAPGRPCSSSAHSKGNAPMRTWCRHHDINADLMSLPAAQTCGWRGCRAGRDGGDTAPGRERGKPAMPNDPNLRRWRPGNPRRLRRAGRPQSALRPKRGQRPWKDTLSALVAVWQHVTPARHREAQKNPPGPAVRTKTRSGDASVGLRLEC